MHTSNITKLLQSDILCHLFLRVYSLHYSIYKYNTDYGVPVADY